MEKYFTNRKYLNMKRKIYLFGCLLAASFAFGQDAHNHPSCGSNEHYQEQIQQDPSILQRQAEFEAQYQEYLPVFQARQNKGPQKFIIPMVFHVFHTGGSENISRAQILDQIDSMNRAYNSVKFEKVRSIFWGVGADCEVEFRLATLDPDGNCTDGVVRIYDPETENATDNIKLKSAWPTDRYFNVWVVKDINRTTQSLGTVLGYAQFPWIGGSQTDGVVIRHDNVGSIGTGANPSVGIPQHGSTMIHEAGHWLGLFHTFQDSCFGGDQVDDTPPAEAANFGCKNNGFNSCSNDNPDLPDMVENYMDYSDGPCMGIFTIGQKARVHASLLNWRKKLWAPSNLVATGTADPYNSTVSCAPKAYFHAVVTSVCQSGTINFVNGTHNTSGAITYQWIFEGADPATSTSATANGIKYDNPGVYDVTLIATNANGTDTFTRKAYIEVLPTTGQFGAGFMEGFEFETFPVNGWKTYSTSSVVFARVSTGEGSIGGAYAAYVRNSAIEDGAKFYLESPGVDLSMLSNPVFSFYYAASQRRVGTSNTTDAFVVQSSTDCGKNWTQRLFVTAATLPTTGTAPFQSVNFSPAGPHHWKKVDVDLSAIPSTQRNNVKIRFEYRSSGGHNFFVDNINIGFSTGIADYSNENSFSVYPNPSAGNTNIRVNMPEGQNVKLEVLDMYGRTVEVLNDAAGNGGEQEFVFQPSSNLSNGMYVIRLTVNGQSFTRKLMLIQNQ